MSLKSLAIAAAAAAERSFAGSRPPLEQESNFLLLQYPLALGTAIHATPLVAALHAAVPNARIAVAASGFGAEVFRNHPGVERMVETPNPLHDLRGAVTALRAARFFPGESFVALQTRGNERSRVTLAAMLGGAHRRIGYSILTGLTERNTVWNPEQSLIANNLGVIDLLGHGDALRHALAAQPELAEPRIYPSAEDKARAHTLLRDAGIDEQRPIAIFITQTSVTQRKSWRPERFRAVAEQMAARHNMQIVFAGTAAEAAAIDALRAPLQVRNASVAGKTSIAGMAALLELADVALTLDTGPMHLARAVQLPMVVIAPAWSPPIEWLPLGNPRVHILKNLDLPEAPQDYVIDEVSVDEVLAALEDLVQRYPPRRLNESVS